MTISLVAALFLHISPVVALTLFVIAAVLFGLSGNFDCPRCGVQMARFSLLHGIHDARECWRCGLTVGQLELPLEPEMDPAPPEPYWIGGNQPAILPLSAMVGVLLVSLLVMAVVPRQAVRDRSAHWGSRSDHAPSPTPGRGDHG